MVSLECQRAGEGAAVFIPLRPRGCQDGVVAADAVENSVPRGAEGRQAFGGGGSLSRAWVGGRTPFPLGPSSPVHGPSRVSGPLCPLSRAPPSLRPQSMCVESF